ncbi:MAG: hypothetical protein ACLTZT_14130 [Butyricimonas faecalis]
MSDVGRKVHGDLFGAIRCFSRWSVSVQTVAINSDSPLNIKMKETTEALDEVVVVSTGYPFTQRTCRRFI